MKRTVQSINNPSRIDGVIPGVRGQRAFPNKQFRTFDPFVMLDHIGPEEKGTSFFVDGENSYHPHRGFETITFLLEGTMTHKDSLGHQINLSSGDVQRMNAGKGIIHGGDFGADSNTGVFHEVQLWVNLPAKEKYTNPEVQDIKHTAIPVLRTPKGNSICIVAGNILEKKGPVNTSASIKIAHVIAPEKELFSLPDFPEEYNLMVYVLKGEFESGKEQIKTYQSVLYNNDGDTLEMEGSGELLIVAGIPLNEPVVMGGPFVMNTRDEIEQAYEDYNNGLFGEV